MMDWNTLLSTARMERAHVWIPQQQEDERSQWQRDHDRLIFPVLFGAWQLKRRCIHYRIMTTYTPVSLTPWRLHRSVVRWAYVSVVGCRSKDYCLTSIPI